MQISDDYILFVLYVILVLILIESITTDTMNFRNLWIILGVISGLKLEKTIDN